MDVFVEVADNENLLIISDRLAPEEFFRLFKSSLMLADLIVFGVECEAVRDPAIVATEYQYFILIDSETADRVAGRPLLVLVNEGHNLPFLVLDRAGTA